MLEMKLFFLSASLECKSHEDNFCTAFWFPTKTSSFLGPTGLLVTDHRAVCIMYNFSLLDLLLLLWILLKSEMDLSSTLQHDICCLECPKCPKRSIKYWPFGFVVGFLFPFFILLYFLLVVEAIRINKLPFIWSEFPKHPRA